MSLVKPRFTTTGSLKEPQGEQCSICKERKPVVSIQDGVGKVCAACDPNPTRAHLIEVVEPDEA